MMASIYKAVIALFLLIGSAFLVQGQSNFSLYGDLKVDETKVKGLQPSSFEIILQSERLTTVGRQTVPKNGRYRFENLSAGNYYVVVMVESEQITSIRVRLSGIVGTDVRQDINLEWKPNVSARTERPAVVSAIHYSRTAERQSMFENAEEATSKKEYDKARSLLERLTSADERDFEAWTELGTVEFVLKDVRTAEKHYLKATEIEPSFMLAWLNLGKMEISEKNYSRAVEILTKAVSLPPPSAEANYFLGEAYLGTGKGSKAVAFMNEALRIEPLARAEIHLRIAAIYDSVGLKDLAAAEYRQFLQKRPGYKDRKKLDKYIAENAKQ